MISNRWFNSFMFSLRTIGRILFCINTNNFSITIPTIIFLIVLPVLTHAQWESDGVLLEENSRIYNWQIISVSTGGFWIAWQTRWDAKLQFFDEDGFRSFNEPINLPVDTFYVFTRPIIGCTANGGNELALIYSTNYQLYYQIYDIEGNTEWDPPGMEVGGFREEYHLPYSDPWPWTVPDGVGGLWIYYASDGLRVCGINADGTNKVNTHPNMDDYHSQSAYASCSPDEEGGLFIVWKDHPDEDRMNIQHISAGGVMLWHRPIRVPGRNYAPPHYINVDPVGGIVLTRLYDHRYLNIRRWTLDQVPSWQDDGIVQIYNRSRVSPPVLLPDSTIALTVHIKCAYQADECKFVKINLEGEFALVDTYAVYDTLIEVDSRYEPLLILPEESNNLYALNLNPSPDIPHRVRYNNVVASNLNLNGESVWDEPVQITNAAYFYSADRFRAEPVEDGSIITAVAFTINDDDGNQELRLFKLYPNGRVAGREDRVEETNSPFPSNVIIRSIYPNPANSSTNIEIDLPLNSFLEISVFNLVGEKALTLSKGYYPHGSHRISLNSNNLPSGVYFLNAKINGTRNETEKIVVMK
ncbi:MAG: T9SS type A sorting domain-containing protein [Candidatus Electryonea clarkiae]|nr:T9SS type A sorting domain-containing protein [Candidatus Electryonea clarkiae]MDP8287799.1 T9SS type A sorting domain-containing protein [Candidatus Electryonea clarkiae]